MTKTYMVPLEEIRREHVVVNSRFISTLASAFSIDEARTFMARIKHEFADASHNVPVYIIGGGNTVTEYFSDDGEPSGTSGKPALAVLRGSGLGDAVLVITRYFGGTLLGTGGLVKAYTESAQSVVNAVGRGQRIPVHIAMIALPYNLLERLRLVVTRQRGEVLGEDFAGDVTMTVRVPVDSFEAFQNDLRELSAGKVQAEIIETKEMIVPVSVNNLYRLFTSSSYFHRNSIT
ncbi:MAG: YigZ family protein [Chloroflexi bacterium]|nr:YigZ family protein [Chloroflexota bacterium]